MLIAVIDFDVAPADREAALACLLAEAPGVRAMEGNLAFRPLADPDLQSRVMLLHEWRSRDDFKRYLGSEAFVRSGAALRPMMTQPPVSRRFDADLIESVA